MLRPWLHLAATTAALGVGACSSATLPALPGPASSAPAIADAGARAAQPNAFETAFMADGSPTEVYRLVARGALNCWLGASGPLHATHVFAAEAEPPDKGGAAEIVLHERDPTLRDQRGQRAFRIVLEQAPPRVRVGVTNLRLAGALAEAMSSDTRTWASGGSGCQARAVGSVAGLQPVESEVKRTPSTISARK